MGLDGPEESQTCGQALAEETWPQTGGVGPGVMGPVTGVEESGSSEARAGGQIGKTAPAETGPCSVFLESAPVTLEVWRGWHARLSPGVPRWTGSAGLGGWSGVIRRIAPWS